MKIRIKITGRYTGKYIYEHEAEGNTLKITVEKAVKEGVKFNKRDIEYANIAVAPISSAMLYFFDDYLDEDHI